MDLHSSSYRFVFLHLIILLQCLSSSSSSSFVRPSLDARSLQANEVKALLDVKRYLIDPTNQLSEWNTEHYSDNHTDGNFDNQYMYCSWTGIICDNVTFAITSLNLSSLSLSGGISPSIGNLQSLQIIDFSHNSITGQIPDEIANCAYLQYMDLSYNIITGELPFSFSRLKELEYIVLRSNQISGPIPATLSQLSNLKVLDLAQNHLSGEIPSLIYWSEVLQYLGLRGNNLSGKLSSDMCKLTGLWYFDVRSNNLSGEIPRSIGNCTNFQILDLAYNQFSGEIPFNIGFLQIATLSLQGNKFSGTIPDVLGLMQALAVLDLSYNELHGEIPPILGNLTYTGKLYLHGNHLTGSIPPELGNMSRLSYLQLDENELSGEIPSELGKLQDLFSLNLAMNLLQGSIPENLSSCTSLNYLNVHGNNLTGMLPNGFQRIVSLTYLNLSTNRIHGSIPEEFGLIRNLDTLDLSHNQISGPIPRLIGDLEHLLILDLSENEISGNIPAEFSNLRIISELDISHNALVGSIPEQFGQLQSLDTLYLNNNNLSGEIPPQMVNCFSLNVLNLSYNNLSGEIPTSKNFTRFLADSYIGNQLLCGPIIGSPCDNLKTYRSSAGTGTKRLIIGISITLVTIIVLLLVLWKSSRQHQQFLKSHDKLSQVSPRMVILHMDLAFHSYEDIMRLTENLSDKYAIGYGASSTVYKCILNNGKPIAIKKLYNHHQRDTRQFETELEMVGRIKHKNLVSLRGYTLAHDGGNLLFYDYMVNGSLWDALHGSTKTKLDWGLRLKIALGAAQGLAYLHQDCNPRIVHRDVKTSNILLDENFEAHLSDFGIAKSLSCANPYTSTSVMGTIGYIDPEYARTSRLNEKSDVYSFGIILLELITGRKAVENEINLHQWVLLKKDTETLMDSIVCPEVKNTCSSSSGSGGTQEASVKKVLQLALLCSKKQPSERPTMNDVVKVLLTLIPPPLPMKSPPQEMWVASKQYHRYIDDYGPTAMMKHKKDLNTYKKDASSESPSSNTTTTSSGGHLFVRFEEVISQDTTIVL